MSKNKIKKNIKFLEPYSDLEGIKQLQKKLNRRYNQKRAKSK